MLKATHESVWVYADIPILYGLWEAPQKGPQSGLLSPDHVLCGVVEQSTRHRQSDERLGRVLLGHAHEFDYVPQNFHDTETAVDDSIHACRLWISRSAWTGFVIPKEVPTDYRA